MYGGQPSDILVAGLVTGFGETTWRSVSDFPVRSGWLKVVKVTGIYVVCMVYGTVLKRVFPHIPGCERTASPVAYLPLVTPSNFFAVKSTESSALGIVNTEMLCRVG